MEPLLSQEQLLEMLKNQVHPTIEAERQAGNIAIRAASIINGGAAIAVLSQLAPPNPNFGLRWPLLWFAAGVLLSAFAAGFAYLTESRNARGLHKLLLQRIPTEVPVWVWFAIGSTLLSLLSFAVGCYKCFEATAPVG